MTRTLVTLILIATATTAQAGDCDGCFVPLDKPPVVELDYDAFIRPAPRTYSRPVETMDDYMPRPALRSEQLDNIMRQEPWKFDGR